MTTVRHIFLYFPNTMSTLLIALRSVLAMCHGIENISLVFIGCLTDNGAGVEK